MLEFLEFQFLSRRALRFWRRFFEFLEFFRNIIYFFRNTSDFTRHFFAFSSERVFKKFFFENGMSLLTIVEVGKSYKFLTMHYSEIERFLNGAEKSEDVDIEIQSDGLVIVDRKSRTIFSSQNIVSIPKGWRAIIV